MSETDGTWQFSGWEATVKQVTRINSPKKEKFVHSLVRFLSFQLNTKGSVILPDQGEMKSDDEMRQPDTGESQYQNPLLFCILFTIV